MSSQEVKEVLLRHRPGTSDDRDSEVQAALGAARQDPELGRWLQQQHKFHEAFRRRLREVQPPAGLKEQILSERRAAFSLARIPRRLALVGSLAVLALILGAVVWWQGPVPENRFATFRSRMVRTALRGYAMDLETSRAADIHQFLANAGAVTDWSAPSGLLDQTLLGCAVVRWQNRPAAMVCYGKGGRPDLWLFIVAESALPDPPPARQPQFVRVNRVNTMSWTENGRTYLLVGAAEMEDLRRYSGQSG